MKKKENIISEYFESFQLEITEAFDIDEEWQFYLARNFFLNTKLN